MSETTTSRVAIYVEPTPNPNSLKFIAGREIISGGSHEFATAAEASSSPIAAKLFEIEGVEGVFIGRDFVTVRKTMDADWGNVEPAALRVIEDEISGGKALVEEKTESATAQGDDAESKIRRILDEEIRPAVASDGGDVMFQGFTDGVLTLRLVGSCSGCPSSTMTLKMGIERRLREDVPELKEVVSLM